MTYQMTEKDWIELAKEFRVDQRSLQEQFDACRADITNWCGQRDRAIEILGTIEQGLGVRTMKLLLITEVMAERHKDDPK